MNKIILFLATLGPIGTKLPAPGTFGSLAGLIALWALLIPGAVEPIVIYSTFGVLAFLAIPICGIAEKILGKEDPKEVILDEFVAQPLVFLAIPFSKQGMEMLLLLGAGFALFRLFDILKPLGISRLQSLSGGLGVVADDIAAAFAAGLCLWFFS